MTTTSRAFNGLAATRTGQTKQVNKAFKGMADELQRLKVVQTADCDEPQTVEQWRLLVASLQNQLADAQALINDMRAVSNLDTTDEVTGRPIEYWDTDRVAKESRVAICTICRNADLLGGVKQGSNWLFPAGTTYGKKRNRK